MRVDGAGGAIESSESDRAERTRCTIYELGTLCAQQTIETCVDERGLVALSADAESSVLAYAGSEREGRVVVHDALNLCRVTETRAHESPLGGDGVKRGWNDVSDGERAWDGDSSDVVTEWV